MFAKGYFPGRYFVGSYYPPVAHVLMRPGSYPGPMPQASTIKEFGKRDRRSKRRRRWREEEEILLWLLLEESDESD